MKRIVFLFAAFLCLDLSAQDKKELSLDQIYALVLSNHPVAQQAVLLPDQAKAEIRAARGFFDPKLSAFFDEKDFDGKKYWNRLDGMLKVPAWIGDFKGSFERNRGNFISDSENTPLSGLIIPCLLVPDYL
jgi:hypothetical protein